jgi:GT2 family glycosyltransferase
MLDSFRDSVVVTTHDRNRGFAAACNTGADAAGEQDYLAFLNNDTMPIAGWLDALVDVCEDNPRASAVGAKLLFPDGTVQHAGVAIAQNGWPRHLYAGFPENHPAVNRVRRMPAVTAACMLVRSGVFRELNGFDLAFTNGYEDVDLCHRISECGHEVWYCPRSVVYHLESVTRWPNGVHQASEKNLELYAKRWRGHVRASDFDYYLEDGLVEVEYGPYDPFLISVSPHLATVRRDNQDLLGLDRILRARSNQVMSLLSGETRALIRDRMSAERQRNKGPKRSGKAQLVAVGRVHDLGESPRRHFVSLILPVKSQERDIRELLPLVLGQAAAVRLELIAVDSGSHDGTVEALQEYGATVIGIDPADFDHGISRTLAARHARGDVLLFMSGRSRPVDDRWLAPLLSVLDEDPHAAGACSRVIPHPDADVLTAKDVGRELSGSTARTRKAIQDWRLYEGLSAEERRAFLNFHTVGSAIRADVFAKTPFRSVRTLGEDLLWAREVTEAGWSLWHEPTSRIYHSHNYTLPDLFSRNVDDGLANRELNGRTLSQKEVEPLVRTLVLDDWVYLRDELGLDGEELDLRRLDSALRRVAQVTGQWMGINHRALPPEAIAAFSGVERARRNR